VHGLFSAGIAGMKRVFRNFIGIVTVVDVLCVLSVGVVILALISMPRALPNERIKLKFTAVTNKFGNFIVWFLKKNLDFIHRPKWEVEFPAKISVEKWYVGMSNHLSWADIFLLLFTTNYKFPLLKFFMKKELRWIPIIYFVHKTIDMPFLNRYKADAIRRNPELQRRETENTRLAAEKFMKYPTVAFCFAEGTRFTEEKRVKQKSPYQDLLKPKVGALMTSLSCMPNVNELIDFTIIYETKKRSAWAFACGEMKGAKVIARSFIIPDELRKTTGQNVSEDRAKFKQFIEHIWQEKQELINQNIF
jgi:1-acyl-sn-glycerol-3-phosphate acyltransferase